MKRSVLVVAPHPDDETYGSGGTLLRLAEEGAEIHWLIVTAAAAGTAEYDDSWIAARKGQIEAVTSAFGFASVHELAIPTATLDSVPRKELVSSIDAVVKTVAPETVFLPYRHDVHSDHGVVFDAAIACTKWFRNGSVKRIFACETLSETDFDPRMQGSGFLANVYVDITAQLDKKVEIARIYGSELGEFPFPRSERAIRALAELRGAASGCQAAEAFMLVKQII